MRYRKERAEIILRELRRLAVRQTRDITGWKVKSGLYWSSTEADDASEPYRDFDVSKDRWTGLDRNDWFTVRFIVPAEFDGKPLSLLFGTQASGWDASNPQFLVYINGQAVCGLDTNHKDVFITDCAKAGEEYRVDLQGYTGSVPGEFTLTARMAEMSPRVWKLYYDLWTPVRAIARMNPADKVRIDLETTIENAVNVIDLREPNSAEFYDSVERAIDVLDKEIYADKAGKNDVFATCVGQTHIDVAWWWTVAQTRQKTVRSFATALKYMDEYPDYVFMCSQPQLYKFVKEHQPAVYEKIKERVAEGRWEVEGGMWLEADCNLTSGESLVRQFLYGKRFFKEEFGVDSKILWLPDVFGYSGALPQIMRLCGVDYFMTTKLSWNQFNRMPYDTFVWRGIDGSPVFTYMITTTGAEDPMKNYYTTYNGNLQPNDIMGAWERFQQKEICDDILVAYGYGDGGGGPTRDMIETGLRMAKGISGTPKVKYGAVGPYFDELYNKVKDSRRLPVWAGELYFEYHRGTYTSMARNKKANRKSEFLLQDLEFASVWGKELGVAYPKEELAAMWETVLLNQFHDILPGTSIKEVYDVTKAEYDSLIEQAGKLLDSRLSAIAKTVAGELTVINTLSFVRDDVVVLPCCIEATSLAGETGTFPCQATHDGKTVAFIKGMPAKGALGLILSNNKGTDNPIKIDNFTIETPFYITKFDAKGHITSLFHKGRERETLKECGVPGNELRVYEDRPMNYDNWDIDVYYTEKSWAVDDVQTMEWLERGPVRATLLIERRYLSSLISQKIHFYAESPRIDFETYVDWKQSNLLLKARMPVDVNACEAAYDIQFGNVTRPTHFNTSWDEARFESCAHKWADLSEGDFGVSLLNDCKYGHAIHDGIMALTLIKSGVVPNPVADQEEHRFTYSLYPHAGGWKEADTARLAYGLNVPAYAVMKTAETGTGLSKAASYLSVDKVNIIAETVKEAEDRKTMVVRMYEYMNARTNATLTLPRKARQIFETDCLENREALLAEGVDKVVVELKPFEIKTVEIVF